VVDVDKADVDLRVVSGQTFEISFSEKFLIKLSKASVKALKSFLDSSG
jgi:hypothetical protein